MTLVVCMHFYWNMKFQQLGSNFTVMTFTPKNNNTILDVRFSSQKKKKKKKLVMKIRIKPKITEKAGLLNVNPESLHILHKLLQSSNYQFLCLDLE